jgi:hypothetical protein
MPYTINVSTVNHIARFKGTGDFSVQLCVEAIADMANHPDFQAHFGLLADVTETTNIPTITEVRKLASVIHEKRNSFQGRIALVVSPRDVNKASVLCMLVRVFGVEMEAYGDADMALKFLRTGQSWMKED